MTDTITTKSDRVLGRALAASGWALLAAGVFCWWRIVFNVLAVVGL